MIPILQKCEKLSIGRLDVVVCDDDVKVAFARTIPEYHLGQNELLVCDADDDDHDDNEMMVIVMMTMVIVMIMVIVIYI